MTIETLASLCARLEKDANGCWVWQDARFRSGGYGAVRIRQRTHRVHRLLYEALVGPISPGLELDHLCRQAACANPAHLEPVTHTENVRRGLRGRLVTECARGHAYTPENTGYATNGTRFCRECSRIRARNYKHKADWSG
jgi:HNH endonuclease